MKKTKRHPFKYIILLSGIIFAAISFSCSDSTDDSNVNAVGIETNEDLAAAINTFTGGDSETYKIISARLSNSEIGELDVTALFNFRDDEFVFTTDTDGQLKMLWHEGFGFNQDGTNEATVMSDTRASSKIESLSYITDQTFGLNRYNFSTTSDGQIQGTISLPGTATLNVVLALKMAQEYLQPPTSLDTVENLFNITGATIWTGFKGSIAQNKLFLTNFNSPSGNGNQRAFLFDLQTTSLSSFAYSQVDHPWINLEIIDSSIYNVGGDFFQKFNFNFDTLLSNDEIENAVWEFGSAAQDDEIYLFGGVLTNFELNEVGRYNVADGVVDIIGTLPLPTTFCDGEIINNKLYIFGGHEGNITSPTGNYENMIFNLEDGTTEIIESEINLSFTTTSVVQNIIYFGGYERIDENGDNTFDGIAIYLGAFDTQTNTTTNIDINFDLLENERLSKLWASEDFIYLVLAQNQVGGGTNLRVVRSLLN